MDLSKSKFELILTPLARAERTSDSDEFDPERETKFELFHESPVSKTIFNPEDGDKNNIHAEGKIPYAEWGYQARIAGLDEDDRIKDLKFCLNGDRIKLAKPKAKDGPQKIQEFQAGKFQFDDSERAPHQQLFCHITFGFQISVTITFTNGASVTLYSYHYNVKILNGKTTQSLMRMAQYVYQRAKYLLPSEERLFQKKLNSEVPWSMKRSGEQEPGTQIQILKDIIQAYHTNLGYFRMSAKSRLHTVDHVDSFEKAKSISSHTLSYTVQHPEHLTRSPALAGLRFGKQYFIPQKTLVNQNSIDYDIYENRVVVGFLKYLYKTVSDTAAYISAKIGNHEKKIGELEYVLWSDIVLYPWRNRLAMIRDQLLRLNKEIELLYVQYSNALPVSELIVSELPPQSAILMSVPPYRLIYEQIDRWFHYGIYDYNQDDFIVPMLMSDRLYEYYVLLKLIHYIGRSGYSILDDKKRFLYREKDGGDKIYNTFTFKNREASTKITLYYEPHIFGEREIVNGIYKKCEKAGVNELGLFRTLSLNFHSSSGVESEAVDEEDEKNESLPVNNIARPNPYKPDYVIKIDKKGYARYIILDAKFSSRAVTREYYVRELLYKYLISISTRKTEDKLIGLVLINGKIDNKRTKDDIENIFDLAERDVTPYAKILSLTEISENMDDNAKQHEELMEDLFGFGLKTERTC